MFFKGKLYNLLNKKLVEKYCQLLVLRMKQNFMQWICIFVLLISITMLIGNYYVRLQNNIALSNQQNKLISEKDNAQESVAINLGLMTAGVTTLINRTDYFSSINNLQILPKYQSLYKQNSDLIGWLKVDDTVIDYPVMQTPDNENYYLNYDFDKEENNNGSLIMDTDSNVGTGTKASLYLNGTKPSSNLIIHGHTMKSGQMFGNLQLYKEEDYGKAHNIIYFDSLYEKRSYELIAIFYSQVFYQNQDVFKYYKFFQANTNQEFNEWYNNIKEMSIYDTGVTAKMGDEFITLSCCSYQVEDGRFVVVGKRIQ